MKLSELQLECQRLGADKTLSFGCIVETRPCTLFWWCLSRWVLCLYQWWDIGVLFQNKYIYETTIQKEKSIVNDKFFSVIIWHPIDRWRLCYLSKTSTREDFMEERYILAFLFKNNPELYQWNILTRPDEVLNEVRNFLLSIQPPCPQQ